MITSRSPTSLVDGVAYIYVDFLSSICSSGPRGVFFYNVYTFMTYVMTDVGIYFVPKITGYSADRNK